MSTEAAEPQAALPRGYQLIVPQGWYRIVLDEKHRERGVRTLVDQQFRGLDNQPVLHREATQMLLDLTADAAAGGALEMYLSLIAEGPVLLAGSLLVTYAPATRSRDQEILAPSAADLTELAAVLDEAGSAADPFTVVELPSGPALRRQTGVTDVEYQGEAAPEAFEVEYMVPVPGTGAFLVLTFSTPLLAIQDAIAGLFDVVAQSLRFAEA